MPDQESSAQPVEPEVSRVNPDPDPDYDRWDDTNSSGAYHRGELASDPPVRDSEPSTEEPTPPPRNRGINARPPLEPFVPEDPPVENKDPQERKRNAYIARLALEFGIPEEYIDKYYLKDEPPGYVVEDMLGGVVAVEDDEGDVITPESTYKEE